MSSFIRKDSDEDFNFDDELYAELQNPTESVPSKTKVKKKGGAGVLIIVILFLLAAGAGVLYYLYSKGLLNSLLTNLSVTKQPKVTVIFEPTDSEVLLDGQKVELTPAGEGFTFVASAGTHNITVTKKGYKDFSKEIAVPETGDLVLEKIVLNAKNPGVLTFNISVEKPKIYLDGVMLENVDIKEGVITLKDISAGKHSLLLKKSGHESFSKEFKMPSDDGVNLGDVKLKVADWRPIEIEVSPREVTVLVSGEKVEVSIVDSLVVTEPIAPGKHKIELQAPGYDTWTNEAFEVFSDLANSIGPISLKKIPEKKEIIKKNIEKSAK